MQNRGGLHADRISRAAHACTLLCAEIIFTCAVLTKFLTLLNKRGGFDCRSRAPELPERHKNAYSAGQNRRQPQAGLDAMQRFCSLAACKLAKIEPFEL